MLHNLTFIISYGRRTLRRSNISFELLFEIKKPPLKQQVVNFLSAGVKSSEAKTNANFKRPVI